MSKEVVDVNFKQVDNENPAPEQKPDAPKEQDQKGETKMKKGNPIKRAAKAVANFIKHFADNHPVLCGFLGTTAALSVGGAGMVVLTDVYVEHKRKHYASMPIGQEPIDTQYTTVNEPKAIESAPAGTITTSDDFDRAAFAQSEPDKVEMMTNF